MFLKINYSLTPIIIHVYTRVRYRSLVFSLSKMAGLPTSLSEKANEAIITGLGTLAKKCNAPFSCSGELEEEGATVVYRNMDGHWNAVTFPTEGDTSLCGLIAACSKASFGYKGETVTDKTYRDALKLEPDQFLTTVHISNTSILSELKVLMPKLRNIRAQLYKRNIYCTGGHFRSHVDTPRSAKMFGSLVLCLPSQFAGGCLVTRHGSEEVVYDWSSSPDNPPQKIRWASFFSNVEHEILPVTSGYRVTLTYNLYHEGSEMLTPSIVCPEMASFKQLLSQAVGNPHFMREGGILGFVCQHKYVFEDLNVARVLPVTLKGADYYIYLEVKSLGVPVVIKPVIHGDYVLDKFAPFECSDAHDVRAKDSDSECEDDDIDCAIKTWFGNSCVDVGVTWCQSDMASYKQPAAAGVVGSGFYGNEAQLECVYQSAAILIGVPRWGKARHALSGRSDSDGGEVEVVCAKVEGEPGSDREMCVDGMKGSGDDGEEESGKKKAKSDYRYYAKIFGKQWKKFCGN